MAEAPANELPQVIDERISAYADAHTTAPADHLRRLFEETHATLAVPQMLTGPVEGRFLQTLVAATGARRILEIGTYSGYSALSMAAALPADGELISCDVWQEAVELARRYAAEVPEGALIDFRLGPALETIATLAGPFDLVFIDADKASYPAYFEATLPLLSERGLIVLDNTLWHGRVLPEYDDGSAETTALRELNAKLAGDPRVVSTLLPIRDGVTLVRRSDGP